MRRICFVCQVEKNLETDFYTHSRGKDGYLGKCKECVLKYAKDQYDKNPQKKKDQLQELRNRNRVFIWDFYNSHPCVDCGETDPIVLELDHCRGDAKVAGVSQLVHNTRSIKVIEAEIAKCDVVCANCHRRRTATTQEWFADLM